MNGPVCESAFAEMFGTNFFEFPLRDLLSHFPEKRSLGIVSRYAVFFSGDGLLLGYIPSVTVERAGGSALRTKKAAWRLFDRLEWVDVCARREREEDGGREGGKIMTTNGWVSWWRIG